MTKLEILKEIAELEQVKGNETYAEFIAHEIELKENKTSSKKSNPVNDQLKELIIEVLKEETEGLTTSEIIQKVDNKNMTTTQKAVALLKQIEGVDKVKDKKVTKWFLLPEAE